MASVRVRLAVGVVDQNLDVAAGRQFRVCRHLRGACDAQHGVPGGDVIVGGEHLGQADFKMFEVDVRASPRVGQELATPVLRVVSRRGVSGRRGVVLPLRRGVLWRHGQVRHAADLAQQRARGLSTAIVRRGAEDEVAELDVGAGELGDAAGSAGCVVGLRRLSGHGDSFFVNNPLLGERGSGRWFIDRRGRAPLSPPLVRGDRMRSHPRGVSGYGAPAARISHHLAAPLLEGEEMGPPCSPPLVRGDRMRSHPRGVSGYGAPAA